MEVKSSTQMVRFFHPMFANCVQITKFLPIVFTVRKNFLWTMKCSCGHVECIFDIRRVPSRVPSRWKFLPKIKKYFAQSPKMFIELYIFGKYISHEKICLDTQNAVLQFWHLGLIFFAKSWEFLRSTSESNQEIFFTKTCISSKSLSGHQRMQFREPCRKFFCQKSETYCSKCENYSEIAEFSR